MAEPSPSSSGPARIFAGHQSDYHGSSRQLVKHGMRNIAVVFHDGKFYAMDNACYHHGGALLRGDIEEMGGHPCIVCPWHSYRITLDTGEGLYIGVELDPTGGKPRQAVKSKGQKQRVYPVTVEANGSVYVEFDDSGPRVESDTYASMAIANQEEATSTPIGGGGVLGGRGPQLHSRGPGIELRSGHVFQQMHGAGAGERPSSTNNRNLPSLLIRRSAPGEVAGARATTTATVSCRHVQDICDGVKAFSFTCTSSALVAAMRLGQYVELEVPLRGQPARRKWTIARLGDDCGAAGKTDFTLIVKRVGDSPDTSGSAWLHERALHAPLSLCRVGGRLTLQDNFGKIRMAGRQVLLLTGGIGITNAYANVHAALAGMSPSANDRTLGALCILHLHVDRRVDGTAAVEELAALAAQHSCFARPNPNGESSTRRGAMGYTLRLFLTQESSSASASPEREKLQASLRAPSAVTCGRRLAYKDIADAVDQVFLSGDSFVPFVCGPPPFVEMCTGSLLSLGVEEKDILTDDP